VFFAFCIVDKITFTWKFVLGRRLVSTGAIQMGKTINAALKKAKKPTT